MKNIIQNNKNLKKVVFWSAVSILVGVFFLYALFFRFFLLISHPNLSVEEYFRCIKFPVKESGPFVITQTGVCIMENECKLLNKIVDCKDLDDGSGGWKIAKGLTKNNFDFENFTMSEKIYTDDGEEIKETGAYFFNIKGDTYFWWLYKGNGRLFKIDKETFKYLGNDRYEDKNGIIIKNERVN